MAFLEEYQRWREGDDEFKKFYREHGFNPDASHDDISQEYLTRSPEERARIQRDWDRLLIAVSSH
jgi:hypothetical protein